MAVKKLDLGCGNSVRSGYVGIDLHSDNPDRNIIRADCLEYLRSCEASTIDEIYSRHFFEHVENLSDYLFEIARVLKPGGVFNFIVPHFSNPYYYSDPTHKRFFGLYTMNYFFKNTLNFKRGVPRYTDTFSKDMVVVDAKLHLMGRPLYGKITQKFISFLLRKSKRYTEFHERNLAYLFPIYEVSFTLRKEALR